MRLINRVLEAIYPSNIYCMCCGKVINETREYCLCDSCIRKFHWIRGRTCRICGKSLPDEYADDLCYDCRAFGHDFRKGYSVLSYGLYERGVILDFKYGDRPWNGKFFGRMMNDRLDYLEQQGEVLDFDLLVPVPIHPSRLKKRGYNQAEILARQLGALRNLEVKTSLLERKEKTTAMKGLDVHSRRMNVRDAFRMPPGAGFMAEGRHILVIDDIFTTGSTADACARILYEGGAETVDVMCLASGMNKPPAGEYGRR